LRGVVDMVESHHERNAARQPLMRTLREPATAVAYPNSNGVQRRSPGRHCSAVARQSDLSANDRVCIVVLIAAPQGAGKPESVLGCLKGVSH
jgi:hypothetical protein